MESQQGMFKLRQRVKKWFFFISFDPRGDGDCFYSVTAHQLSLEREREQVKNLVFQYLENHQIDVSKLTSSLYSAGKKYKIPNYANVDIRH